MDLAGRRDADAGHGDARGGQHATDQDGKLIEDSFGALSGFGGGFGLSGEVAVDPEEANADVGAAEVDTDSGSYAFFSSSFLAAEASSLTSATPFLNSFTLLPRERASSGSRLAPKSTRTIRRIRSSSW